MHLHRSLSGGRVADLLPAPSALTGPLAGAVCALAGGAAALASAAPAPQQTGPLVLHAGTVLPGDGAAPIENGAVVVADGKIVEVGRSGEVEAPAGARSIDYGDSAVLLPGLVAVDSAYVSSRPGPRTADPTVLAIDAFDPYRPIVSALQSGITTAYLAPARGRLIAGQGAVVKTAGGAPGDASARIVLESAGLHGSISEDARRTPGYWEPPVPATVDKGLGVVTEQLPRTTMGAVLALDELMAFAGGDDSFADEYGPLTGPALAKAIAAGVAWRMGAESAGEVRAILDAAERYGFPLVVDGASDAVSAAAELAAAGVPVIARPHFEAGANRGKSATGDWPEYDTIARLVGEGVRVAISTPRGMGSSDLRFAAALAMRGGLGADRALDAITIEAARILGVDGRVGSLRPGKDADLVVMTGAPLSTGASVLATVVGGEIVWSPELARSGSDATRPGKVKRGVPKALRPEPLQPVVVSVDELHVGDGTVHRPGEVLLVGGKVAEVGARVARPAGARVVRGAAAMPGMIDAWGHLGLDGIGRAFSTRLDATRILEPGDYADRQVARRGVTTVNLASTSLGSITPTVAYKPAADSFDGLVIDGVATVFLEWNSNITTTSGDSVRQTLARARKYVDAWNEYEAAMATWTPPAPEPAATDDSDEDDDESEEEDDDDKPKKKKRKKGERDPAKPVTGVFEGTLTLAGAEPGASAENARLRFDEDADGGITGSLRTSLFEDLLAVTGSRDGYDVTLSIETPDGTWAATLAQIYSNDPKPKKKRSKKKSKKDDDEDAGDGEGDDKAKKVALVLDDDDKKKDDEDAPVETYLRGEVTLNEAVIGSFDVTQVSSEFKRIRRPRIEPEEELERKKAPKGKPKEPKRDSDLEPFRRALRGEAAVIVSVDRRDQVLACVDAFEAFGVAPILYDSDEAHTVAGQIADRVSGALMPRRTLMGSGATRLAALASAGIPVGFPSQAEEGAAELGVFAAMAVARGLSPSAALRGLTGDAAKMLRIDDRVGRLAPGLDADVIVLDGDPLEVASSVVHAFVNGREVQ